jgi:hypothetical protein
MIDVVVCHVLPHNFRLHQRIAGSRSARNLAKDQPLSFLVLLSSTLSLLHTGHLWGRNDVINRRSSPKQKKGKQSKYLMKVKL